MIQKTICIVGLGYVGLPLAHAFGVKGYKTLGFDIAEQRIAELRKGIDRTHELTQEQLVEAKLTLSADPSIIRDADIVILAIPTPVDEQNNPDLSPLEGATRTVGQHLKKGMIIVFESTVYPGVTEDLCGPILEKESGLKCGTDFTLGYSPERINPGDKEHTVSKIVKVVGAQDEKTLDELSALYGSIISAGVHRASSIRVAEMSKAIENAQRDLNIAYVNEIAKMCGAMGIPTNDVLEAAGSKWNFLRFQPGLVGGHCIGVDPYYLVHKAKELSMELPIISSSRMVNDGMGKYVADKIVDALKDGGTEPQHATVLVLGLTFKENVPDTRNSQSQKVIKALEEQGCTVIAHDPFVSNDVQLDDVSNVDAIALLVGHTEYLHLDIRSYAAMGCKHCIFYDLKSLFDPALITAAGMHYLSL